MKKTGTQTIQFDNPVTILETASIVGPKESGRTSCAAILTAVWKMSFGEKKVGKKLKVK